MASPADLVASWTPAALPLAHALHPSEPLLALCSAQGALEVVGLKGRARVASAAVSFSHQRGGTLVLGGQRSRPTVAWVGAEGLPWLWAFGADSPAGPASSPICLEGVADFLPTLPQGRAHCRRLWLSAVGRPWLVCGAQTGGGLVSNGRIATHLDGWERIIGAASSPDGRRLALLTEDGVLTLIEDPALEPSPTDALGPSLLVDGVSACPVAVLKPVRLRLPLGMPRRALRDHEGAFPGAARIRWVGEELVTVAHVGPNVQEPQGHAALRPRRSLAWVGVRRGEAASLIGHTPLPSSVDLGVQLLERGHPLSVEDEEGAAQQCWLAPQPHGAMVGPVGRRRPVVFVEPERLQAHAEHLQGHVEHLEALRDIGLRWDGREILLDQLRPDAQALGPHGLAHESVVGGLRTGPVDPVWVSADDVQVLVADPARADRVLHYRPPDVQTPRVMVHPTLNLVPDEVRWRYEGRPHVRLLSVDVAGDGEYMAMWRAPGGVELWSLRVSDRLKAWALWPAHGSRGVRVLLAVAEPGYLPGMFILEATEWSPSATAPELSGDPAAESAGCMSVSVRALEFGDVSPQRLGSMKVPVGPDLDVDDVAAVSRWLGQLRLAGGGGEAWMMPGVEGRLEILTARGGRAGRGGRQ